MPKFIAILRTNKETTTSKDRTIYYKEPFKIIEMDSDDIEQANEYLHNHLVSLYTKYPTTKPYPNIELIEVINSKSTDFELITNEVKQIKTTKRDKEKEKKLKQRLDRKYKDYLRLRKELKL